MLFGVHFVWGIPCSSYFRDVIVNYQSYYCAGVPLKSPRRRIHPFETPNTYEYDTQTINWIWLAKKSLRFYKIPPLSNPPHFPDEIHINISHQQCMFNSSAYNSYRLLAKQTIRRLLKRHILFPFNFVSFSKRVVTSIYGIGSNRTSSVPKIMWST